MLRAAQGFGIEEREVDGAIVANYQGLVRKISLEQLAESKGHPAATPDHWLKILEEAVGNEEIKRYLIEIDEYKEKIKSAMHLVRTGSPTQEVEEELDV
jgi:hypothetical protein